MTEPFAYRENDIKKRIQLRHTVFNNLLKSWTDPKSWPYPEPFIVFFRNWLNEDREKMIASAISLSAFYTESSRKIHSNALALAFSVVDKLASNFEYELAQQLLNVFADTAYDGFLPSRFSWIPIRLEKPWEPRFSAEQRAEQLAAGQASLVSRRLQATSLTEIAEISRKREIGKHYQETTALMEKTPQPQKSKGTILFHHFGQHQTAILPILVNALMKRGYAAIPLSTGHVALSVPHHLRLHQFAYVLPDTYGKMRLDWTIDIPGKIISALDINFYDRFFELLIVTLRKYSFDWNAQDVQRVFKRFLRLSDSHLYWCDQLYQTAYLAREKVGILFNFPYIAPQGIWLDYVMAKNNQNFRLIYLRCSHIVKKSWKTGRETATICAVDMALHPDCRVPFLPPRKKFEQWYKAQWDSGAFPNALERDVAPRLPVEQDSPLGRYLLAEKAEGKRIVCCYGRILYDRALRKDGGPGHTDIVDWLLHSIAVASETPDLILLIKAHPHETDASMACWPLQQLRDVLPKKFPHNVLYVQPGEISTTSLASIIDLAALWLGTAAYELTSLGVPVAVCSDAGKGETPFDVIIPFSRDDYATLLRAEMYHKPNLDTRNKATAYMQYLLTDEVVKDYQYAFISASNDFTVIPHYDPKAVERYFSDGDAALEEVVDQILEGFQYDAHN
jgi:capsular polysaccharide export protein